MLLYMNNNDLHTQRSLEPEWMSALEGERVVHAACGKWYTAAITGVWSESEATRAVKKCFGLGRTCFCRFFEALPKVAWLCCSDVIHHFHNRLALDKRCRLSGMIALGLGVVGFQEELSSPLSGGGCVRC